MAVALTRDSAAKAANKAFLANRIGDFGFMIGILLLWSMTGGLPPCGPRRTGSPITPNSL